MLPVPSPLRSQPGGRGDRRDVTGNAALRPGRAVPRSKDVPNARRAEDDANAMSCGSIEPVRPAPSTPPPLPSPRHDKASRTRSEEHTSELQSLMRISYAVFCFKKKNILH